MNFVVVIPARYASTRLPGKPLLNIGGKPMIQRVYEQAMQSGAAQVLVATDDDRIRQAVQGFGGEVCMTSADHSTGTDRLAQVARDQGFDPDTLVVNLQGDEPLMPPEVVRQVADNLNANTSCSAATLCESIQFSADFNNPAVVKVVADLKGRALYFSRAPIPWPRDMKIDGDRLPPSLDARRHIGLYAYRAGFLQEFVQWQPVALESTEMLEQLRILAHGHGIHLDFCCRPVPAGIDTPADLERVRKMFAEKSGEQVDLHG